MQGSSHLIDTCFVGDMWKLDGTKFLLVAVSPLLQECQEWDCIVVPEQICNQQASQASSVGLSTTNPVGPGTTGSVVLGPFTYYFLLKQYIVTFAKYLTQVMLSTLMLLLIVDWVFVVLFQVSSGYATIGPTIIIGKAQTSYIIC